MRDDGAPIESAPQDPRYGRSLFDADFFRATWHDPSPPAVAPRRLDQATTIAAAMLLLGVALLWFVPLGGALLLVTAGLGLAISAEGSTGSGAVPLVVTNPITTTSRPLTSSAQDT